MDEYVKKVLADNVLHHRTELRKRREALMRTQTEVDEHMTSYLQQCERIRQLQAAIGSEEDIDPSFAEAHTKAVTWRP